MKYAQRKKNQQAWLQKRGFWMPTLRSFFDLPVTMTQEEWREYAAPYVPHGQDYAHTVPAYRVPRLLESLESAAARHGCSVEKFEVMYNSEYSQIVAKMEKRYAFREVLTRRSTSKYFTVNCYQCGGSGKEVTGYDEHTGDDITEPCIFCGGSGKELKGFPTLSIRTGTRDLLHLRRFDVTFNAICYLRSNVRVEKASLRNYVFGGGGWRTNDLLDAYINRLSAMTETRLKEIVLTKVPEMREEEFIHYIVEQYQEADA